MKENEKFAEYIYNPIKALCWLLSYKLRGGDFTFLDCDGKRPDKSSETEALKAEMKKTLDGVRAENRALSGRIEVLEKLRTVDIEPADKQASKQPKK